MSVYSTAPHSSSAAALQRSCSAACVAPVFLSSTLRSSLTPGPASPSSEFCQVIESSWPHSWGLWAARFPHISGFSSWAPWVHSWLQMAWAASPADCHSSCSCFQEWHLLTSLPSCLVGSISTAVINLQGQGSCLFNLCKPYSVFVFLVLNKWWFNCVKSSPSILFIEILCTLWGSS